MTARAYDAVVIGGGCAGMAAALAIRAEGLTVAIVEREPFLGGILVQCIHNGFGIHRFGEDLTGPEFAARFIEPLRRSGTDIYLDATVMEIDTEDPLKHLVCYSRVHGILRLSARVVVLAMGCRERNRGNIAIAGTRPAGVFTAGLAQRLVNVEGVVPGHRAVVIGSGDIGLIMARRLTLVGCQVPAVVEIQPYPSGIVRNIAQCLNDFAIPLYLSHVVSRIRGRERVEGVDVTPLADGNPDVSRTFSIACDTVLLSVGLIPENELSVAAGVDLAGATAGPSVDADLMTSRDGIFACGNVLHVHDLVDHVTEEAERCGRYACAYVRSEGRRRRCLAVAAGANVRSVTPNGCAVDRENVFYLRPLVVRNDAELIVRLGNRAVKRRRFPHVQPSEMIRLTVSAEEIGTVEADRQEVLEVSLA